MGVAAFAGHVLASRASPGSQAFQENLRANTSLLEEVCALQAEAAGGGGSRYVERHRQRGKLLPRERVELLVDPWSPVLELSPLAGYATGDPLGGGVVVVLGVVAGTQCLIIASDPTVRGGAASPTTVIKQLRALDVAAANRLPVVYLAESAGADLPKQADIFLPGGAIYRSLTRLSAAGVPTVTVVHGSSTAGGAYVPGMSDYAIFVRDQARVYLGGPPLVKMAIDEDADEEELGGALMHSTTSGSSDFLAADERDGIRLARMVVGRLRWRRQGAAAQTGAPPRHDPGELLGIAPADVRRPFDVREVLARVLDGSVFDEFKALYGTALVTGFGAICGYPVGVIANNGILFPEEAQKGSHFIQLCDRNDTPILFVQNITGFMVGTRYEQAGIIKEGAKLINAVSNSGVPHLTLMVGASYGAGNYGMSGVAFEPRFIFTWPNHRIAVMGPKQLAGVMDIVTKGRDPAATAALEQQVEAESTALYATGRVWDDGIIDPRDTRTVLGLALGAIHSAPVRGGSAFGVFRM